MLGCLRRSILLEISNSIQNEDALSFELSQKVSTNSTGTVEKTGYRKGNGYGKGNDYEDEQTRQVARSRSNQIDDKMNRIGNISSVWNKFFVTLSFIMIDGLKGEKAEKSNRIVSSPLTPLFKRGRCNSKNSKPF